MHLCKHKQPANMCWQPAEQLAIGAWCIDGALPLTEGGQARARKSCAGNLRNCGDAVHIIGMHLV